MFELLIGVVTLSLGVFLGYFVNKRVSIYLEEKEDIKVDNFVNDYLDHISNAIDNDLISLIGRINSNVTFEFMIEDEIYLLLINVNDYTSITVLDYHHEFICDTSFHGDLNRAEKISKFLYKEYEEKIEDIVQIFDMTYNRDYLCVKYNLKISDDPSDEEIEEIEDEAIEKQATFDLNSILDKIRLEGIESLTKEELDFLNKKK